MRYFIKTVYVALAFAAFLSAGCKPNQDLMEDVPIESRSSLPQASKKTELVQEDFNQDVHVIKTIWRELEKLKSNLSETTERKMQLVASLEKKMSDIALKNVTLSDVDKLLLDQVREYLQNPKR